MSAMLIESDESAGFVASAFAVVARCWKMARPAAVYSVDWSAVDWSAAVWSAVAWTVAAWMIVGTAVAALRTVETAVATVVGLSVVWRFVHSVLSVTAAQRWW